MEQHNTTHSSNQERVAQVVWASHILASFPGRPQPSDSSDHDREEHENAYFEDSDADSEAAAALSGQDDRVQTKVLDCIAQLFSPGKGWAYVTATAIRHREDFVEIDIARNDTFAIRGSSNSLHRKLSGFDPRAPDAQLYTALTQCLSVADPTASCKRTLDLLAKFERCAIAYAASRTDHWVTTLRTLLGSARKHDQDHLRPTSTYEPVVETQWHAMTNLLSRQDPMTSNISELLVRKAHEIGSSLNCRLLIFSLFEPGRASKIWSALLFLSRPLADVQLLWHLAGQFPQYRDIRIYAVRRTLQTRLSPKDQINIEGAWTRLISTTPSLEDIAALKPFSTSFQKACSNTYNLHAEMQLVDFYNSSNAEPPTMDYFGGSKKSCFLCEIFLESLPSPIRTRGRHGICYRAWGIPCPTSVGTAVALDKMKDVLVSRIQRNLRQESSSQLAFVPQSTLVPDLSDSVFQRLTSRDTMVKEATKEEEESREKQRILKGTGLQALPLVNAFKPLLYPENSCVMCSKTQAKLCSRCKSCYYCSKKCQESDWAAHKYLCRAFAEQHPRPSRSHKRAIFFPCNHTQPLLIWVLCKRVIDEEDGVLFEEPTLQPYFGHDKPCVESTRIDVNPVRGRLLGLGLSAWALQRAGYSVSLKHRDTFLIDGSPLNRSLLASVSTSGTISHRWCGPLVAMRETHDERYEDITAGDFRHLIDYVTSYLNTTTPENGLDPHARAVHSIRGVKLTCYGEERLHGTESFVPVDVPFYHPAKTEASVAPVSRLLGVPLRLWRYPDMFAQGDPPGWEDNLCANSNRDAAFLMFDLDVKSANWGFTLLDWSINIGNVLVVRQDEKDLDADYLRLLCCFLRVKLQPMIEDALSGGDDDRTRQKVLDFIAKESLEKFSSGFC